MYIQYTDFQYVQQGMYILVYDLLLYIQHLGHRLQCKDFCISCLCRISELDIHYYLHIQVYNLEVSQ